MLQINGKTFMNLQEAVQWLLDNNALPFQSSANYVANTEIGIGTIVNPSPAKVRIGSLIFFADSKVSTVIGLTENGFIVSDQYNDLVDDVVYVSNVAINASGHLIVTLSNGDNIDAGLIKQVSNFSIDASQHLIANYNDGTSTDLGAIFTGNINISGNITATGSISAPAITGDSIIENMSGYSATMLTVAGYSLEKVYIGAVKNGNKLTVVFAFNITKTDNDLAPVYASYFEMTLPPSVMAQLHPVTISGGQYLDNKVIPAFSSEFAYQQTNMYITKQPTSIRLGGTNNKSVLDLNKKYYCRYEATFLLSNSLV